MKTIKKNGVTLYPVCSFEKNQHKIENAYNKAYVNMDEDYNTFYEISELYDYFNTHVYNGKVYADNETAGKIKELIAVYDHKTDMMIATENDPERQYLMSIGR